MDTPRKPTTDDTTSDERSDTPRAYNRIPRTGRHRGNTEGLESGMNVRAPKPPDLERDDDPKDEEKDKEEQ